VDNPTIKTFLCFLFYAPMGAGKTTLIREFGQALEIKENITSPTFVGMNEYHCDGFNFYHFDLYQVGIKFEDLAEIFNSSTRNLLVIEWAEKLEPSHYDYLNRNCKLIKIKISVNPDESRIIELD
jgi:tRNA threonylcarbamoyladenosine biosynthesis protein TsaE